MMLAFLALSTIGLAIFAGSLVLAGLVLLCIRPKPSE